MITQRPQLTFSILDASDSIGNMSLWLADGVDLATAAAAAASFRGLAATCTDGEFIRQAVVFSAVAAPKPLASSGADGNRVGVFVFSNDGTEFGIVELDSIKDEALLSTGPGAGLIIDRTNPAIAALVTELLSGFWCNPFGYPLVTLEAAYLHIRR